MVKGGGIKRVITLIAITLLAAIFMAAVTACGKPQSSLQKLPTPTRPEKNGSTVSWQNNSLYLDFIVSVDGEQYETSENSFDITFAISKGKPFDVKVKALGDGVFYADSDWSKSLTVSPLALSMELLPNNVTYRIIKCGAAYGDIVLPQTYNGLPVVEIGKGAFSRCNDITSITIPYGVTEIGGYAFSECENLEKITLPDTVEKINNIAFEKCKNLKSVNIPNSVTFIGRQIFSLSGISDLTVSADNSLYKGDNNCLIRKSDNTLIFANENSEIPTYVEKIAQYAIESDKVEAVTIPYGVKKIEQYSINCRNLKRVEISASVTEIETGAFSYTNNLAEFIIADDNPIYKSDLGHIIRKSDNVLMFGCNGDIAIPDYVTGIAEKAFYNHNTQSTLFIPKNITWIGAQCFAGCYNLEYAYLPNTLKELGWYAFGVNFDANGKYKSGTRSITIPEGCVRSEMGTEMYSPPECEIGYDDGFAYVISYSCIVYNNTTLKIAYDDTSTDYFHLPYRYGYTLGGFAATPNGSRITTDEQFQQTVFTENGIKKTRVYPIWIPNE